MSPSDTPVPSTLLAAFPAGVHALVTGASGAIGAALVDHLQALPQAPRVRAISRRSDPPLDLCDEAGIAAAARALAGEVAEHGPFQLVIHAGGVLHADGFMPEKRLADLNLAQLQQTFAVNTFGPALLIRHLSPLLDRQRAVFALLSAKVGSIGDNRLGGWTAYRASKAALNMVIKTASIELRRSQPRTTLIALHPGTVQSALSRPFRGGELGRPPAQAATDLLHVIDRLTPDDSGEFFSWDGSRLPW
jgi:NAD(P)-dependent dehydrogenase (short-subunit alcohol dehydrogenase family)